MAISTVNVDFSAILQNAATATGLLRVRLSQVGTVEDSETGDTVILPIAWQETTLTDGAATLALVPNKIIEPCANYTTVAYNFFQGDLLNKAITETTTGSLFIRDTSYSDAATFKAAMSGVQLVYELATPQTIQLTPQQVELLQGENNLFSDGEMTLVYLADGNASEIEALNILLGGRYVNNHTEDEPTDREALNIILGGNER